jgi:hypothetical protein
MSCLLYPILAIIPLASWFISLVEIFFSLITILREITIEIKIVATGWILVAKSIMWLATIPIIIAIAETPTYLIIRLSYQASDSNDELTKAVRVEKAAPSAP